jgi:membrane protease YdiL (CAAX protease family)
MRSLVLVDRETCETAGDMEANLPSITTLTPPEARTFPYSNWGPAAALFGVILALTVGILLGVPALIIDSPNSEGDLSAGANAVVQLGTALGFLIVPLVMAGRGGASIREALRRLGLRPFRVPSALKWMAAAVGAYLLFAIVYSAIVGEPDQEDIADSFGPIWVQILLIVIAASVSEEVCFRGMLFGGLRERMPRIAAALLSAVVFGALHALTGISAVPPLIAFGFILALLYEKTGSIVPGIILHMLNNSAALLAQ